MSRSLNDDRAYWERQVAKWETARDSAQAVVAKWETARDSAQAVVDEAQQWIDLARAEIQWIDGVTR